MTNEERRKRDREYFIEEYIYAPLFLILGVGLIVLMLMISGV
jgi:hypothetical protein